MGALVAPPARLVLTALAGFALGWVVYTSRLHAHVHKVQLLAGSAKPPASPPIPAPASGSSSSNSDPCSAAFIQPEVEYWGSVVVAGHTEENPAGLAAASAEGCCRACQQQAGCNQWVWCHDPARCGRACWLKREGTKGKATINNRGPTVPWTSGLIDKDFDVDPAMLGPAEQGIAQVELVTQFGSIRIQLRPEWSEPSVAYVRHLAQQPRLCTAACEFYRAEPGFLLQGSLRAYIPANTVTQPGPKLMERGDIGWAGGGPGPDWFIYLGAEPAAHFGTSHTVWGQVADAESLAVVERIVSLPASAPKPGDMHMLDKRVPYTFVKHGAVQQV